MLAARNWIHSFDLTLSASPASLAQKQKVRGPLAEGWLYRTAIRQALHELRRVRRQNRFERLLAPFRQAPQTPEQLYEAEVEQANVRTVLAATGRGG